MSDNTEQPGGGPAPHDPWAPPDSRVDLGKTADGTGPPAVHDQPTMASVPGAGAGPGTGPIPAPGPTGFGPPAADVPAPPIAPNGPGAAAPPPAAQYGYPAPPAGQYGFAAPPAGQYGYPAPPAAPYGGGYAGYPGYGGQAAWGPAPANGLGVAALVLGIIGVVAFCMWGLGVILGILALVFGIVGRGRARRGEATNGGAALAGIILGSVSIVISAAFLGIMIYGIASAEDHSDDYDYDDPYSTSLVVDAR